MSNLKKNIVLLFLLTAAVVYISGCRNDAIYTDYYIQYDKAVGLMADKKYDEAEEAFGELSETLENDVNQTKKVKELKADVEYALGKKCLNVGDYQKAYDYYLGSYVYYKELLGTSADKTIDAQIQQASIAADYLGRDEQTLTDFEEIYEEVKEPKYKNIALCFLTQIYINMDNGEETESYIDFVKAVTDSIPLDDNEKIKNLLSEKGKHQDTHMAGVLGRIVPIDQYLSSYYVLGSYYIEYDEPDKAIEMYQNALDLIENSGYDNREELLKLYERLGFVYLYFKGETETNEYLNKVIALSEELYPKGIEQAGVYIDVSEMYLRLGDYDKFGQHLDKAVDEIETVAGKNHWMIALSKGLLSQYYRKIGEYQQAIDCCEEAIEILKNILEEDRDSLGSAYNNLAGCYSEAGYKQEAIEAFQKSIEIYRLFNNDLQVAVAERNIALIYNNSFHDHAQALLYARDAISLVENMDQSYYGGTIAAIYMVMADILYPTDYDYSNVEDYSEKAYQCLIKAVGNVDEAMANYHYNLGKYFSDNKRYSEALPHLLSAEELFKDVYKETVLYPVDIFYDIGYCYYNSDSYSDALLYFKDSVEYDQSHIEHLREQGNYRNDYWLNNQKMSQYYLDIESAVKKADNEAVPAWYEIYRVLVNSITWSEYTDLFDDYYATVKYAICDIDKDGVPELITTNGSSDMADSKGYVFSFDSEVQYLGTAGYRDVYFWRDASGERYPGIFTFIGNTGFMTGYGYVLNDGLLQEITIETTEEYQEDDGTSAVKENRVTDDDELYSAYKSEDRQELEMLSEYEINSIGWDAFVGRYVDSPMSSMVNGIVLDSDDRFSVIIPDELYRKYSPRFELYEGTGGYYFYLKNTEDCAFAIICSAYAQDLLEQDGFRQYGTIQLKGSTEEYPIGIDYFGGGQSSNKAYTADATMIMKTIRSTDNKISLFGQ